ncbi:phosphoribosylformimino-5-aminoimidazole carboxamide ribonucleotide [Deferribacter desulfuricans SSM1]|uniref:1-(5-phosphoribosyl)-5-[(5-phosphoribosylamino)methylideneamino] imidazole-4-carboxamide isomerase n=1 Tax=Deferribacter desulfuricans (strain DSM 14783 / JCM 11476 / NBRC 101012 / SSM1) TaxID=639282 RepID=D3PAD1_DEFDS|nr:1-(5-phosphoribosyl)-5-[(5-phosphoribosylamino)methylideneamino]imidazole-4-carboxamide isomerase [Deferribacter desulfuricans]BAI79554.1 phosphoribosylformimino-5-aminoimidazole carboxamide ribonucleotide [Deferribacter desulfuricans SSM1]
MLVIPAIDILEGKVVRLKQGVMKDSTKYFDNPLDVAKMFQDLGAKRIHIVDLDGAKEGTTVNFDIISKIVQNTNLEIEVGGGIRNFEKAEKYFNLGINYIIIGTAAIKNREFTKEVINKYENRVILGFDCKDENVATDGWYEKSDVTIFEIIDYYKRLKPHALIYTDISRDGMLTGLNFDMLKKLANYSEIPIIASGGVKGIEDIIRLQEIPRIYGCIVGKAFYEGKIDLKEAFKLQN